MTPDPRRWTELAPLLAAGVFPFYLNGLYNGPFAAANRSSFWVVEVATWVVMPAVLLFVGHRRGYFTLAELGLTAKVRGSRHPWILWVLAAAVPFVMWRLDVSVAAWASAALPPGWALPPFRYADVVPPPGPDTGGYRLLALAYLCVGAGVVEELYYRAMMNRLFSRGWASGVGYVLMSSAVFAGAHWEGGLPNLVEAFAVGVFAATTFRLTGNLWPLILGHAVTDWYWFAGGPSAG